MNSTTVQLPSTRRAQQKMFAWIGGSLLLSGCPSLPPDGDLTTEGDSSSSTAEATTESTEATSTTSGEPTTGTTSSTGEDSTSSTSDGSTGDDSTTAVMTTHDTTTSSTSDGSTTEGVMTGESTSDASTTEDVSTSGTTSDETTTSTTGDSTTDDSTSDGSTTGEPLICGDGFVDPGEACDDGNNLGGDACTPACEHNPKIVQLVCGTYHSCAVLEDGTMRCWGGASAGQLGYGDSVDRGDDPDELPTPSVPVGGSVLRASSSGMHTCAVLDTGKVRCWGIASGGALGNGTSNGGFGNSPGEVPPPDIDVGAPARDVEAGGGFTCVITEADNVRCWGSNLSGELGYGHTDNLGDQPGELPVPDLELGGPVAQIAAGGNHACAVLKDGTLRCWGGNYSGQLGYGDTENRGDQPGEMPPPPVDVGGPVAQVVISTDFEVTCALRTDGVVLCWGDNQSGSLGLGPVGDIGNEPGDMPPPPVPLAGPATAISFAALSGCALLANGELQCWGSNGNGAVGVPGMSTVWTPTLVDVGGPVLHLDSGNSHRCAALADGTLRCWGGNVFGRLGLGHEMTIGKTESPASVGTVPY
jgi:cysteine-rich repeat protein